jgi:hypothetical protein
MPRIKTTPMARAALWALRIYLLILLSLIVLKFTRVFSNPTTQSGASPAVPSTATNQPSQEAQP